MYTYENIVGNEHIITHFINGKKHNKLSHTYMLVGEEGAGKKELVYTIAKAILCEKNETGMCNTCGSCMKSDSHNNPDIIKLVADKSQANQKDKPLSVDNVREQLISDIYIKPYEHKYKIYIIEDADKMNANAQNALLKTLEEPPQYAITFLLAKNAEGVLKTIRSRSVIMNMSVISNEKVKEYLVREEKIPDYLAELAADFSAGRIGMGRSFVSSNEFADMKKHCVDTLNKLENASVTDIISNIKTFEVYKKNIDMYFDMIIMWYRDVMLAKATQSSEKMIYRNDFNYVLKQADLLSYNDIGNIFRIVDETRQQINANVNFDTALELMFLKIKEKIR